MNDLWGLMTEMEVNTRIICLIIAVLLIGTIIGLIIWKVFKKEEDYKEIPNVKWPFINLRDENGKNVNMLCIRGPIIDYKDKVFFRDTLNKGVKYIGCSSYLSFPNQCQNPAYGCEEPFLFDNKRLDEFVIGWCHCFRNPSEYIKSGIPKLLLSESDFVDNMQLEPGNKKILYDFICYCPKDDSCENGWHYHNKNWPLTRRTIETLCNTMGLKGFLVGREDCEINLKKPELLEMKVWLDYYDFIDKIRESKIMIVASKEDASPRTLTEALLLNKPVLVNEEILGGWKYVNSQTGLFYNEETIIQQTVELMRRLRENQLSPRDYFFKNHGRDISGKKFKDFLQKINPDLSPCSSVIFPTS